jgi:hypothetical protein
MLTRLSGLTVFCCLLLLWDAPASAAGDRPEPEAGEAERQAPVAQVPTMLVGHVRSVNIEERTFTMVTRPRRRRPPGQVVVAINSDTEMTRNQMVSMDRLGVGDRVRVHGEQGAPVVYAEGTVAETVPLVVTVSEKVKLIVEQGARLQAVRLTTLRLEDMFPGMEVQAMAWRGEGPLVAKEVQSHEVLAEGPSDGVSGPNPADTEHVEGEASEQSEELRVEASEP